MEANVAGGELNSTWDYESSNLAVCLLRCGEIHNIHPLEALTDDEIQQLKSEEKRSVRSRLSNHLDLCDVIT